MTPCNHSATFDDVLTLKLKTIENYFYLKLIS